jgi:hypothetical protein
MKKRKQKDINRLFKLLGWHGEALSPLSPADAAEATHCIPSQKPPKTSRQGKVNGCGKTSYTSEKHAKQAARHRLNKGANVSRLRAYRCNTCNLWHLSSKVDGFGSKRKRA